MKNLCFYKCAPKNTSNSPISTSCINCPSYAQLIRPVSSDTTTAATFSCSVTPTAARWRKPAFCGRSAFSDSGNTPPADTIFPLRKMTAPSCSGLVLLKNTFQQLFTNQGIDADAGIRQVFQVRVFGQYNQGTRLLFTQVLQGGFDRRITSRPVSCGAAGLLRPKEYFDQKIGALLEGTFAQ